MCFPLGMISLLYSSRYFSLYTILTKKEIVVYLMMKIYEVAEFKANEAHDARNLSLNIQIVI